MKRFGIDPSNAFGVAAPNIRLLAKQIKNNHALALRLWNMRYHEARILAALIADPSKMTMKIISSRANDSTIGRVRCSMQRIV